VIEHLNSRALTRLQRLRGQIESLRIACPGPNLFDFGVQVRGGLQAGLELAAICMGDAGTVSLTAEDTGWPRVQVYTDQPGLACIGCQYGGWPVRLADYFAIGSGPIRLRRGKEPVLERYGWQVPHAGQVVGVLESGKLPDVSVHEQIAAECQMDLRDVFLCVAPTRSLAGSLQIVARSVEATMHKLLELDVDLTVFSSGFGTAPLPPVAGDDVTAIGRTNDAILYAGNVILWADLEDEAIQEFGPKTPSNSSSEFGRPFAEMFAAAGGDFYQLDPMLFSAARVTFVSNFSGRSFTFGETRPGIVRRALDT
jgi:methenyltetrahydromethanopterin cyclohydrolase